MSQRSRLNLARAWRPKTFQDVIGQSIPIGMLRNSLYKNHFFPLYIFAGQKGCGKTSTARILAAALNCERLPLFQHNPEAHSLPCLACSSCLRMQEGAHPDFIEIDAASHTGVDDVRSVLDACAFMPLLGSKKIYLIDEAHMLSRAAFNAFLKILEEPPLHTMFMFATTELTKIPDTVRSRSFQLHFSAINAPDLQLHLEKVCQKESIAYEAEALALIIQEADRSARDALNILEQVRFAHAAVNTEAVRTVLGIISPARMGELLLLLAESATAQALAALASLQNAHNNPARLWHLLLIVVRELIWTAYGALTPEQQTLPQDLTQRLLQIMPLPRLHALFDYLWKQESLFLSTPYKQAFLEKVCLDIVRLKEVSLDIKTPQERPKPSPAPAVSKAAGPKPLPAAPPAGQSPSVQTPPPARNDGQEGEGWTALKAAIVQAGDPILQSIFSQARVESVDASRGTLTLIVAQVSGFFIEKINDSAALWRPLLQRYFDGCTLIVLKGSGGPVPPQPRQPQQPIKPPEAPARPVQRQAPQQQAAFSPQKPFARKQLVLQDILATGAPFPLTDDNKKEWPYTALLYDTFPGKIEVITPPRDE